MSKVTKIGDTLPKNTPTSTQNRNFANDINFVKIILPVNSNVNKICFNVYPVGSDKFISYAFDYLPNVDINQYMQFLVNLYHKGDDKTYSTIPPESL